MQEKTARDKNSLEGEEEKKEQEIKSTVILQAPAKENEKTIPAHRLINLRAYGLPDMIDIKVFLMKYFLFFIFIMRVMIQISPVPKYQIFKCTIQRDRSGLLNFFNRYYLTFSVIHDMRRFS